jgi:hypothetical protein
MNKLNFEMVEDTAEKIAAREPKSPLEKSFGHHDLVGVWGGDFLTLCRLPLEDGARRKKMVGHQLANLILIDSGELQHVRGASWPWMQWRKLLGEESKC